MMASTFTQTEVDLSRDENGVVRTRIRSIAKDEQTQTETCLTQDTGTQTNITTLKYSATLPHANPSQLQLFSFDRNTQASNSSTDTSETEEHNETSDTEEYEETEETEEDDETSDSDDEYEETLDTEEYVPSKFLPMTSTPNLRCKRRTTSTSQLPVQKRLKSTRNSLTAPQGTGRSPHELFRNILDSIHKLHSDTNHDTHRSEGRGGMESEHVFRRK